MFDEQVLLLHQVSLSGGCNFWAKPLHWEQTSQTTKVSLVCTDGIQSGLSWEQDQELYLVECL